GVLEIFFFGQPFLRKSFVKGSTFLFQGPVKQGKSGLVMASPYCEAWEGEAAEARAPLLPEYSLPAGLSQRRHRQYVARALELHLASGAWRAETVLLLERLHRPATRDDAAVARRELAFQEFLVLAQKRLAERAVRQGESASLCLRSVPELDQLTADFPFPF